MDNKSKCHYFKGVLFYIVTDGCTQTQIMTGVQPG